MIPEGYIEVKPSNHDPYPLEDAAAVEFSVEFHTARRHIWKIPTKSVTAFFRSEIYESCSHMSPLHKR